METSKNKSGILRSIGRFAFIGLIIKEKPPLMTSSFYRKNMDCLLFPLEKHWAQGFKFTIVWQPFACVLINHNRALGFLCVFFNARCNIYSVPNTSIGGTVLRSRITSDDSAGCDANTNLDWDFILGCLFNIKAFEQFDHFKRSAYRMFTMSIVVDRRAEDCHQAIPFQLINSSVVADDGFKHQS